MDTNKTLRESAEQGDADAQFCLGTWYYDEGKDRAEAIKWFRKAAMQGHVEAQFMLGFFMIKMIFGALKRIPMKQPNGCFKLPRRDTSLLKRI